MIQNFVVITRSATSDTQQLSQAPSLWLEHHIAVLCPTQNQYSTLYSDCQIKAFVNKSHYHVIKHVAD